MASVNINVSLDNGSNFSGAATMEDNAELLAIAKQLADMVQSAATVAPALTPASEGSTN